MTRLSFEQVLKDNNTSDSNSILTLQLNHKALSDVSCLGKFKNLEKLDLKLNNLTSLEGLRSCVNLKWLSVVENKLESLEGIQGLSKLTVLNAGKNNLKSMDQVMSLLSLRALILNENKIVSICKLDQMKDLNTLVLSKNPIRKIGDSLAKMKSITKLSLSYCQLQTIDSSLKSCVELKELRLAHNEIKCLPDELIHNSKLLNLDLGNNVITRWSDLKVVVKSFAYLRNLNLQGNPVATNEKIARKIRKALPKLQIFNAKPVDKYTKNEKGDEERDSIKEKQNANLPMDQNDDDHFETTRHLDIGSKSSKKRKKNVDVESKKEAIVLGDENAAQKKDRENNNYQNNKKKGDTGLVLEENVTKTEKKLKKVKNEEQSEVDVIDNAETSFVELFKVDDTENVDYDGDLKATRDVNLVGSTVISSAKRKSSKKRRMELPSSPLSEIGTGGPSTWGDE
ncbi:hypothetical protein L6164_022144 [Bauhinia variegata]|uniref:Uncharacterized protein n=1 Tax=Bauhinia variegata TaxID=167791 RepID=A0ACB9MEA4_BAUVA|nr:hypothetical protein L6164_022144 [Bauhinia variegata]